MIFEQFKLHIEKIKSRRFGLARCHTYLRQEKINTFHGLGSLYLYHLLCILELPLGQSITNVCTAFYRPQHLISHLTHLVKISEDPI